MGDYFILRHPCQATPLDRIKCGFIRPVFVNANDKTNIKREIALTDNFLLFPSHGKCIFAYANLREKTLRATKYKDKFF